MKKTTMFLLAAFSMLLLSACASTGNKQIAKLDKGSIETMFVDGKTTKKDVKAALGEPSDVDFDNTGHEKWVYTHKKSRLKAVSLIPVASLFVAGTNDTNRKLVMVFNEKNVLVHHLFTKAPGETKQGLLA